MNLAEGLSTVLIVIGAVFIFVAAVGIIRLPDVFTRSSATSKAGTLGVGAILLAVALSSNDLGIASRALATVIFVFLTAPVAAHRICRAAYFAGSPLWAGTVLDELRGRYDAVTHSLSSFPQLSAPETNPPEDDPQDGCLSDA